MSWPVDDTDSDPPSPPSAFGQAVAAVALAALVISGLLSGVFETLLVPLRFGSVIAPVSVLLAGIINVGLVILARQLYTRSLLVALPLLGWAVACVALAFGRREGDVLIQAGGAAQWVWLGMVLVGTVGGVVAINRFDRPRPTRDAPTLPIR